MSRKSKGYLPRIPGRGGNLFRRSSFLDGKIRTFYAPGQTPTLFNEYENPTDWNKAGTMLRPPQVCWLNIYLANAIFGPTITQTWRMFYDDTRYSSVIAFFDFTKVPPKPYYYGDGPFTTVQPNADYPENVRVSGVFNEAKSTIEALRPGRTWIEVIDWSSPAYAQGFNRGSDGFLQFPAPSVDDLPFFGTDFFNIWAGVGLWDIGDARGVFNPYVPESNPLDDPYLSRPYDRLVGTVDSFVGYRSNLYHPDNGADWHAPSPSPASYGVDGTTAVAPAYYPYETQIPLTYGYASDFFDLVDSLLSGQDVKHSGAMSSLTVDSVIALIADHYGFDPSTGKDLG